MSVLDIMTLPRNVHPDDASLIEKTHHDLCILLGEANRAKRRLCSPIRHDDQVRNAIEDFIEDEIIEITCREPCIGDNIWMRYLLWINAKAKQSKNWTADLEKLKNSLTNPKLFFKSLSQCGFSMTKNGKPSNKVKFFDLMLKS